MNTQHTPELWPEFDNHPNYGKRLASGNDAVILNRTQYKHARACVNACAGMTQEELDEFSDGSLKSWIDDAEETLKAVCISLDDVPYIGRCEQGILVLKQQHDKLLAALQTILQFDGTKYGASFDMKSVARKAIAKHKEKVL